MKRILLWLVPVFVVSTAAAQSTNSFPLWPDGAPGALGQSERDIPTLTVYLPDPTNATGAAMVICPGGAYAYNRQNTKANTTPAG